MYILTKLWRLECHEVVVHRCAYDVCISGVFFIISSRTAYVSVVILRMLRVDDLDTHVCLTSSHRHA